ncbi:MAG: flagellin [Bacillota bacterium]|nr:flagellin [Bacillota bacterium]
MIINYNSMASNALRQLNVNSGQQAKSMAKLSSGLRINSAADDAAGLAISEKMKGQIRGLDQASRNAQDGQSLVQTAEGALSQTTDILQRMRELATQSSSDTNTTSDRSNIQQEVDQLAKEITRISNTTEFNKQNLLAGGLNDTFQIGANAGQNIQLNIGAMDAQSLGVAGNAIGQGAFTATGGVTSVSNLGGGLTAQTYKLTTTATASAIGTEGHTGAATTAATFGGTYSGVNDANLIVKTTGQAAGVPTTIQVSFDNGQTWGANTNYTAGMNIGNGVTFTAGTGYNTNDQNSVALTASKYTAQLKDSSGNGIGAVVNIANNQTSAVIGDASTGSTMQINFAAGGITAATGNLQAVTVQSSTAAQTGVGGVVTTQANTLKGIDVSSQGAANNALTTIDTAIQKVSDQRAVLGAYSNRLDYTVNNLTTSSQNISDAQSRIANVDMAKEMMTQSKYSVLAQAAQAMLAQANQQPQQVLQLLRG